MKQFTLQERQGICQAWEHYLHGEPLPVDVWMKLMGFGIVPEYLLKLFNMGIQPPLDPFYKSYITDTSQLCGSSPQQMFVDDPVYVSGPEELEIVNINLAQKWAEENLNNNNEEEE